MSRHMVCALPALLALLVACAAGNGRPSEVFDDVPEPAPGSGDPEAIAFLDKIDQLPAATSSLARVTMQIGSAPPVMRAALASVDMCHAPPLSAIARHGAAAPEAVADLLLDRERLLAWLACGRSAAKVSRFTYHYVTLQRQAPERDVFVTLLPSLETPPFRATPRVARAGLSDMRCSRLVAEECEEGGLAAARIDRLGMVGVGELSGLIELARAPSSSWTRGMKWRPLAREQLRGRDVAVSTAASGSLEFLDLGHDLLDQPTDDIHSALLDALSSAGALYTCTIASSLEGPALFEVQVSSPAQLAPIASSLESFRMTPRALSSPAPAPTLERIGQLLLASSFSRALRSARVSVTQQTLRLEMDVTLTPAEQQQRNAYRAEKARRFAAMGRVLAAIVDSLPPAHDDLVVIGGPRLPELMVSRAGRVRAKAAAVKPLEGFPGVEVPATPTQHAADSRVELRYADGSAKDVDELFDTLVAQGFELSLETFLAAPVYRAHRGSLSLAVRVDNHARPVRLEIEPR